MGVEYARFLVPRRDVQPSHADLARLLAAMRHGGWLPDEDSEATSYLDGVVGRGGIAHLRKRPAEKNGRPARFEWDYVPFVVTAEWLAARPQPLAIVWRIAGPVIGDTVAWLRYPLAALPDDSDVYYDLRLVFAAQGEDLEDLDLWLPGEIDHRFSLSIDCSKCFLRDVAEDSPQLAFDPRLRALVERELGVPFDEIGHVY